MCCTISNIAFFLLYFTYDVLYLSNIAFFLLYFSAVELGTEMLELDVHLTADGQVFVVDNDIIAAKTYCTIDTLWSASNKLANILQVHTCIYML